MKKKLVWTIVMLLTAASMFTACGSGEVEERAEKVSVEDDDEDYDDEDYDDEDYDDEDYDDEDYDDEDFDDEDFDDEEFDDEDYDDADYDMDDYEGVGDGETLEDIFANKVVYDALQAQIDEMVAQYSDYYDSAYLQADGNVLEYVYIYAEGLVPDVEAVQANFESMDQATLESSKDSMESAVGIRPEAITYTYYSYDGDLVYTCTF